MIREIVTIDEDLCDGCGLCIPSCHEGALKIINGKAKLVSDKLCDGLGDCLGHCPQGAIKVERRESEAYDEVAVQANRGDAAVDSTPAPPTPPTSHAGGCPGTRLVQFASPCSMNASPNAQQGASAGQPSQLTHWPVQLRLLPPTAPVLKGAKLLFAADCVPVAYADFHSAMLRDHAVVITCPKFDGMGEQIDKLTAMIRDGGVCEVTIARMEVPCCGGLVQAVVEAHRRAASSIPLFEIVVTARGEILTRRKIA